MNETRIKRSGQDVTFYDFMADAAQALKERGEIDAGEWLWYKVPEYDNVLQLLRVK